MLDSASINGANTQGTHPSNQLSTEIVEVFEKNHFQERLENANLNSSYYYGDGKMNEFITQTVEALSDGQSPSHIGNNERAEDIFRLVNQAFAMSKDSNKGDTFIAYLNEKLKSTGASLVLTQERTGIKGANAPCKLTLSNGENYKVIISPYNPWIIIEKQY